MLSWLNALKIGPRVALGFLFPMLGLLAFSGFVIHMRASDMLEARALARQLDDAAAALDRLHRLRAESDEPTVAKAVDEVTSTLAGLGRDEPARRIAALSTLVAWADATRRDDAAVAARFRRMFHRLSSTLPSREDAAALDAVAARSMTDIRGEAAAAVTFTTAALAIQCAAVVFGLGLTLALAVIIARSVTRPLGRLDEAMRRLAAGDADVHISDHERRDELGAMARTVTVFKENKRQADMLTARRDEEALAKETRRLAVDRLTAEFDRDVTDILTVVGDAAKAMAGTADRLTKGAAVTERQSTDAAAAAKLAARNVGGVAEATERLTASIADIAREVARSTDVTGDAVERARQADALVLGLADAVARIDEVTVLIHQIAGQTNLLALNATIEAARAGEMGKGFAVVAGEVKSLADRTARATDEISDQIAAVRDSTTRAVAAIQAIGGTIVEIDRISAAVAAAVDEQSAVLRDIGANLDEAATGARVVSENVGAVADASRENGASAKSVGHASDDLARQSDTLRRRLGEFLSAMRAA